MGRPCKCCIKPPSGPCCLCQEGWNLDTWSVSIFDKTFSGEWLPKTQPEPFDRLNGCHARLGATCFIDNPRDVWNCSIEQNWSNPTPVDSYGVCCPQCICRTTFYLDELGFTGLTSTGQCVYNYPLQMWEVSEKGWYIEKGWVQESHWGQLSINCGTGGWDNSSGFNIINSDDGTSVIFTFVLYYQVVRFYNASVGFVRRFRLIDYECEYLQGPDGDFGVPTFQQTTVPSNIRVGDWEYRGGVDVDTGDIIKCEPCQPCYRPQTTFFGNCPIVGASCPPFEEVSGKTDLYWANIDDYGVRGGRCSIHGPHEDLGNVDGVCTWEGILGLFPGPKTYRTQVTAFRKECCSGASDIMPPNTQPPRNFRGESNTLQILYQSDPIKCDEMGCTITLKRKTGPMPLDVSSLYYSILPAKTGTTGCGPIPAFVKVIPRELILSINPCPGATGGNVDNPPDESIDTP